MPHYSLDSSVSVVTHTSVMVWVSVTRRALVTQNRRAVDGFQIQSTPFAHPEGLELVALRSATAVVSHRTVTSRPVCAPGAARMGGRESVMMNRMSTLQDCTWAATRRIYWFESCPPSRQSLRV